ncbi:MAG TPA: hypothetical protein VFH27_11260, partial [Longimicrobiaceae bacterium]|nr:hypothetical protein [Longimicrobiaceae bacterium]
MRRRLLLGAATAVAAAVLAQSAPAQFGGALRGAAGRLGNRMPNADALLHGTPPITSNIRDAVWAVDSLDNF